MSTPQASSIESLLNQLDEAALRAMCETHFPDIQDTITESATDADIRRKLLQWADRKQLSQALTAQPQFAHVTIADTPTIGRLTAQKSAKIEWTFPKLLALVALIFMVLSVLYPLVDILFGTAP